jgi:hypothetical protein
VEGEEGWRAEVVVVVFDPRGVEVKVVFAQGWVEKVWLGSVVRMGSSVAVVEVVRAVVEGVMLVPLIGRCAAVDDTVCAWLGFNLERDAGRRKAHF